MIPGHVGADDAIALPGRLENVVERFLDALFGGFPGVILITNPGNWHSVGRGKALRIEPIVDQARSVMKSPALGGAGVGRRLRAVGSVATWAKCDGWRAVRMASALEQSARSMKGGIISSRQVVHVVAGVGVRAPLQC